ncbi:MAG: SEC-C metal-binding domain-containing protein [Sandaracinaceae bacterium]
MHSGLIEEAATREPVVDEVRALAERVGVEALRAALEESFELHEIDAATVLALALLASGEPPPADAVVRIYPDALSDRAAQVLVASHPEWREVLERMLRMRQLDRYQLAVACALYTVLEPEGPWPPVLFEVLRSLARTREGWVGEGFAVQAALRVGDAQLDELFKVKRDVEKVDESLFSYLGEAPGIDSLEPTRSNVIASGYTARRATPKVGRNDPCPCGSGKKHKKCCAGKKEAREALSPVAGLTMREYRKRLHEVKTAEELAREHPADLARLPLEDLTTAQLDACYGAFIDSERFDDAERALSLLSERELPEGLTVDGLRAELVTYAHDWGHDELVTRHLERFEAPDSIPSHVALGRVLRHPTADALSVLEAECRAHIVEGGPAPMVLAYELLEPYPALGIVMARGSLDPEHPADSETLLAEIEWARDRLGAPPDDPAWSLWDLMNEERRLARAGDEEREALQRELEKMRAEAQNARADAQVLSRELNKHRGQLEALESRAEEAEARRARAKNAAERAAAERDVEAAKRLRQKIRELEGRIREGQRERRELRERAEELASQQSTEERPEEEESLEERQAPAIPHGVRIPTWTDKAVSSLDKLPKNIVASAIATAGALGAGRPEAWRHAKKLEGLHGLCSARVGIHHRLLFAMDDDGVLEVDEVVTREDLDRALASRR